MLICPPGTERLDITVDKWAVEQSWQDAREDKMPSARVFFLSVITAGQQLVKIPEFTDNIIIFLAAATVSSMPVANIYLIHYYWIISPWSLSAIRASKRFVKLCYTGESLLQILGGNFKSDYGDIV